MMKMKVAAAAAVLGTLTIPVQAGSLERNNMPVELLFEPGNLLQFSYTGPRPDLSAEPFGSTGSVFDDFSTFGFVYKTDLNDAVALGLFFNQPFGANNGYGDGPLAGYAIDFQTSEVAAVLSYELNSNLSLHGGLRSVQSELDLTLPAALGIPGGYAFKSGDDRAFGYLLGASYEVPERGARVTLTYQSAVKHTFESTEFGTDAFGETDATLPQSVKIDGEIALNSDTLLLGGVKWSDYSAFDVAAPGFATLVSPGKSVIDYMEDNIIVNVGLGRSINDEWSVFGILDVQLEDDEQTALRPYNGSRALTVGAIYVSGQYKVTAGAQYRQFNDTVVNGSEFSDNTAFSPFLRASYSF